MPRLPRSPFLLFFVVVNAGWGPGALPAFAAPQITNVSLRGLRIGATTTVVIEGFDLMPGARVLLPVPVTLERVKEGSTPGRIEIELTLPAATPPGRVPLRIANSKGVSNPIYMGIDDLQQKAFAQETTALPVALYGNLPGEATLETRFRGKKGEPLVIEVEARRLGANIDPLITLLDPRGVQLAWAQGHTALGGDARLEAKLPADGSYTIQLHDVLYRGGAPNHFRLKVGDLHYADLAFPLGIQKGKSGDYELLGRLPPGSARVRFDGDVFFPGTQPLRLPSLHAMTGPAPGTLVGEIPEIVVSGESNQNAGFLTVPVAVDGRIERPGKSALFAFKVRPGQAVRFSVLSGRVGSPLDALLTVESKSGQILASSDDSADATDPEIVFTPEKGTEEVQVRLKDIQGHGGPAYVYRLSATPADRPDFSLRISEDRVHVARSNVALLKVQTERRGYQGPIDLQISGLPADVRLENAAIPRGASDALVSIIARDAADIVQRISQVIGVGKQDGLVIRRVALRPETAETRRQPWVRSDLAYAVTERSPLRLEWDNPEPILALGGRFSAQLKAIREPGADGPIRLTLITTQVTPQTPDRKNDVARTLRFEGSVTIPARQTSTGINIVVPGDLPMLPYDVAVRGELLSADGKTVVAQATSPALRLQAQTPIALELAGPSQLKAVSGSGPTGKLVGKVIRKGGFNRPVNVTLTGLPAELPAPMLTVPGDKTSFEFPVSFPFNSKLGKIPGVKLTASSSLGGNLQVKSNAVPVSLQVVRGEPPPPPAALYRIFEDETGFATLLNSGPGQIALETADRFSGTSALKITAGQRSRQGITGWGFTIARDPGPGQFRYLRFAWRKQGSGSIALQLHAKDRTDQGFRYVAESEAKTAKGTIVLDKRLPEDWVVVTRDLFADFGASTLTGIGFDSGGGDYALFDHIYLARTLDDFAGCMAPLIPQKPLAIFEDDDRIVAILNEGGGRATIETSDRYSGAKSVKITPDQRFNERLPGLGVRIRQDPRPGEYRYLRFAWKKKGGDLICLQLNHDGQWGPTASAPGKFRYYAGPGPEPYGAALQLGPALPADWVVVTRDLYADFGEFTLTGIALSPLDGDSGLFDHIYLGRTMRDFEQVRPKDKRQSSDLWLLWLKLRGLAFKLPL